MSTKFYKNEKFQVWFYPILYFILTVAIVVTCCFIFNKKYYQPIVVTGESMWPTLAGGRGAEDYSSGTYKNLRYNSGLADLHRSSINELKRFDVVVTYYPESWGLDGHGDYYLNNRSFKIKRVWGFPGEKITLRFDEEKLTYTFSAIKLGKETYTITSSPVKEFIQTFECYSGDTYSNSQFLFTVNEFVLPNKTFRVSYTTPTKKSPPQPASSSSTDRIREFTRTLASDEYFVMGDNWRGSTDCFEKSDIEKLSSSYLQGRVISINSYVTYSSVTKDTTDPHDIERMYEF